MNPYDDDNLQIMRKAYMDALDHKRSTAFRFADSILGELEGYDQDELRRDYIEARTELEELYQQYSDAFQAFLKNQLGGTP